MDRDNIIDHIKKLQQHEREEIIAECVKRFGVIFGDWEIGLKEENTILFINKRTNKHGFIFTKDGEFKII